MIFDDLVSQLQRAVTEDFLSVSERNPALGRAETLPANALSSLLIQYSWFSRSIVSLLLEALYSASLAGWIEVVEELRRNIGEEIGADADAEPTASVAQRRMRSPHYAVLVRGFEAGFGVDLRSHAPTPATRAFLDEMKALLSQDAAQVAGAVYALECSATPELEVAYAVVRRRFEADDRPIPQELATFFEMHISSIEPGHRDRLAAACRPHIGGAGVARFDEGFRTAMGLMDTWWTGLAREIE